MGATAATLKKDWHPEFIARLRETANVRLACEAVNIERSTAYRHRHRDEDFALEWADALDEAVDKLEKEAWRRAHDGTEKPVYQGGKQVGTIREYSDTLLIFLLKGHRPKVYRERVEHSGPDGGPIPLAAAEKLLDESLAE